MSSAAPVFRTETFRAEREEDWLRLERLLDTVERRSARALSDDDLLSLPLLYRSALSSLSVARDTILDADLIAYLEALSARAYFVVYGTRTGFGRWFRDFVRVRWPEAVRHLWPEIVASLLFLLAGTATGYLLVANDPNWFYSFVPGELAGGRDPTASTQSLRAGLYGKTEEGGLGVFATSLFTHNSQVAIGAFALGFAFGVPSALLMIYNGAVLGAFLSLYVGRGVGADLGGWLLIHGTTELTAIVLAGAAGIHIGRTIAFPGGRERAHAAAAAGRRASLVMVGVVLMLLVAGLLEGYGRQLVDNMGLRYAIAGTMLALWIAYFTLGGRRAR